jgi:hypothetical protein
MVPKKRQQHGAHGTGGDRGGKCGSHCRPEMPKLARLIAELGLGGEIWPGRREPCFDPNNHLLSAG